MEENGTQTAGRKKMKLEAKRKSFADIPIDVFVHILSGFPPRFVWSLRSVCKDWKSLIEAPSFAELHLRRSQQRYFMFCGYNYGIFKFYSINKDDGKAIEEFVHQTITTKFSSCTDGLICYVETDRNIKVCNPSTDEVLTLPKPRCFLSKPQQKHFLGFDSHSPDLSEIGFDSTTKKYKVLAVNWTKFKFEVFTLGGTKSWREVQAPSRHIPRKYERVYANGCVFWLSSESALVAFDFAKERFKTVQLPPDFDARNHVYRLKEMGGCLCLVESNKYGGNRTRRLRILASSGTWTDQSLPPHISSFILISSGVMLALAYRSLDSEYTGTCYKKLICYYDEEGQVVDSIEVHGAPPKFYLRRFYTESLVSLRSILADDAES